MRGERDLVIASFGGFLLGTVIGWSSPAAEYLKRDEGMSDQEISWVTSIIAAGAIIGLIVTFFTFDLIGRKWYITIIAPVFVASWIALEYANNFGIFFLARILTGFCGGMFCVAAPTYTAEISDKNLRGTLGVAFQLFLNIGIFFDYLLALTKNMTALNFSCAFLPFVPSAVVLMMPETPVYLMRRNREEEARKALQFYRGKKYDIESDLKDIKEYASVGDTTIWQCCKQKATKRSIFMLIGIQTIQQLSGITSITYYISRIFREADADLEPDISSVIVGAVQVLASIASAFLVDRTGRRLLWFVSLITMGICHLVLGTFFFIKSSNQSTAAKIGWVPLTSLCVYIVGYSLGAGPLAWAMTGELLPNRIKGSASSIAAMYNWSLALLVAATFPELVKFVGAGAVFVSYGVLCFLGFVFIYFYVIDTKGKTLEQIQEELAAFGGFLLGTVIGWSSPAIKHLKARGLNEEQISWVSSIIGMGAIIGLAIMFFTFGLIGRKWYIILITPIFVISWVIIYVAKTFILYLLGRILTGLCGAMFCVVAPTYTAEISDKHIRGLLGVCFQLFLACGQLYTFTLALADQIGVLNFACAFLPLVPAAVVIFMPETPVYLLKKGHEERARNALQFYRGKSYDIEPDLAEMKEYTKVEDTTVWHCLKQKSTKRGVYMLIGIHAIQQLSGIASVMYYTAPIFKDAGSKLSPDISAIILAVVKIIATTVAAYSVDKIGRRWLWYASLISMGASNSLLGVYFILLVHEKSAADKITWLPLVCLCIFIIGYSLGAGPLPWVMLGELLPNRVKCPVGSVIGMFNWSLAWFIAKTFPTFANLVGTGPVFIAYGALCFLAFVFVYFCLIETKGKTLEEIQTELSK